MRGSFASTAPGFGALRRTADRAPERTFWLISTVLALAVTALMRNLIDPDGDVAWLLTAAERMLDGSALYVDLWESNPPASIFLYVPAVLLARATGLRPETATDLLVCATVVLSLGGALRIVAGAALLQARALKLVWGVGLALFLILPLASFGQREHVATAAMLPLLACLAVRRAGFTPTLTAIVCAGVGAGVADAIKPIFALALVGPLVDLALQQSWRKALALPEVWIAGVLTVIYTLIVIVSVPAFAANVLPLVLTIYVPAHNPFSLLVLSPSLWIWIAFVVTVWRFRPPRDSLAVTWALASAGLMACFWIQAKGFAYHGLPAILVAGLAVVAAAARSPAAAWRGTLMNAVPALFATVAALLHYAAHGSAAEIAPGLTEALRAGPPVRRMLAISNDNEIGPVLARTIGAEWVGSQQIAWVVLYARVVYPDAATASLVAQPIQDEKARYAADIARGKPDVLLVEGDTWMAWVHSSPALEAAFADYTRVGRYGQTLLFRRTSGSVSSAEDLHPDRSLKPSAAGVRKP